MKKFLIAAALLLQMSFVSSYAQEFPDYSVSGNRVYYGDERMDFADARTFTALGFGYAKDRDNVYYEGLILDHVDPYSFRLKDSYPDRPGNDRPGNRPGPGSIGYYKTDFNVYFAGRKLEEVMASTFTDLGGGYGKDSFNVYFEGRKLEGNPFAANFVNLGGGYGKDTFDAFYCGVKIEGAFAANFKYVGYGYAEDGFDTYYLGRKE